MKWFLAFNALSLNSERPFWESMVTAAVESARRFTTLRPHLLYDGELGDPFLDDLRNKGVTVHARRVSIYDAIAAHPDPPPGYLRTASGTYLRIDIPEDEPDPFILYTDCDVLFRNDVSALATVQPAWIACAPEFDRHNAEAFNAGVMIVNTRSMAAELPAFRDFIKANHHRFTSYDQDAYRDFYQGRVDRLPDVFNWKPYWGPCGEAAIVHFHGPKPRGATRMLSDETAGLGSAYRTIFDRSPEGYRTFLSEWRAAASGYADALA